MRLPALVIPYFDTSGRSNGYAHVKLDRPRKDKRKNEVVKYESPKDQTLRIYFTPDTAAKLSDPQIPLLITEGRKEDCEGQPRGVRVHWRGRCVGIQAERRRATPSRLRSHGVKGPEMHFYL